MSFEAVATIGKGVEIRKSGIPGGGNGLWTARPFHRNDLITEYCGPIIDHEDALKRRKQGKATHIRVLNSQWLYIDGLKTPAPGKGGASFANDARDPAINNAVFVQRFDRKLGRDRVFLKATRDIPDSEEVFVSYGNTYWQNSRQEAQSVVLQQDEDQQQQQPGSRRLRCKQKQGQVAQQQPRRQQQHEPQLVVDAPSEPTCVKRGPGRPRKHKLSDQQLQHVLHAPAAPTCVKCGPGRPRKHKLPEQQSQHMLYAPEDPTCVRRGPGRPRKQQLPGQQLPHMLHEPAGPTCVKRGPGRPKKQQLPDQQAHQVLHVAPADPVGIKRIHGGPSQHNLPEQQSSAASSDTVQQISGNAVLAVTQQGKLVQVQKLEVPSGRKPEQVQRQRRKLAGSQESITSEVAGGRCSERVRSRQQQPERQQRAARKPRSNSAAAGLGVGVSWGVTKKRSTLYIRKQDAKKGQRFSAGGSSTELDLASDMPSSAVGIFASTLAAVGKPVCKAVTGLLRRGSAASLY